MAKIYRSAMGKQIDVDHLRLTNEHVIAVGNMQVNARGDELGPGGKIVKTRDQIMKEYYSLNTPVAVDPVVADPVRPTRAPLAQPSAKVVTPDVIVEEPIVISPDSGMDEYDNETEVPEIVPAVDPVVKNEIVNKVTPPMRGSLASSVAAATTVTQTPKQSPKKSGGVQRF